VSNADLLKILSQGS